MLYAIYGVNQYTITFNANGGEGTSSLMDYGVSHPSGRHRAGYTRRLVAGGSTLSAQNATYTAQWILNSYTITFDPNGGNGGARLCRVRFASQRADGCQNGYTFAG